MTCGCAKATFSTRGKAEAAVTGIKRHGEHRPRTPQRAYPCPTGKGWHLTSALADDRDDFAIEKGRAMRKPPSTAPTRRDHGA